jgi:hypothetical protein
MTNGGAHLVIEKEERSKSETYARDNFSKKFDLRMVKAPIELDQQLTDGFGELDRACYFAHFHSFDFSLQQLDMASYFADFSPGFSH